MPEVSNIFVVLLGMGTVFFGLICIVILCSLMSSVVKMLVKPETKTVQKPAAAPAAPSVNAPIADRQAIIAATCAVIAEELGEDVNNIKVVSFKRV